MNKFEEDIIRAHEYYVTLVTTMQPAPDSESKLLHFSAKMDAYADCLRKYREHKTTKSRQW